LRRWPFWFFVGLGLVPNAIFSSLNLAFNSGQIIPERGQNAAIFDYFWHVQVWVVNGVAFPIAVFLVFRFAWDVLREVGRTGSGQTIDANELVRLRRRALWVGDYAGWLGMALWLISGIVFPLWLHLKFGSNDFVGPKQYASFLASQIVCGWIASTLTFFLLTFMFVRAFYPVLVRPEQANDEDVDGLMRLERRCSICVYLTVAAPFFAIMLLAMGTKVFWAPFVMAGLGGICSLAAFKLLQAIRGDLAALAVAINPNMESSSVMTDTGDSLWTSSR
jgi:hypothetical protein